MSLPLQFNNQPSSSPSKSSLRRTSGTTGGNRNNQSPGPTTHFASEATQHHFLPHSPPNQNLDYDDDEEDDGDAVTCEGETSYQTAPQPPISFQPFFTLVQDTVTSEHYHPTVHYIFTDDDPDIITEAACRSLDEDTSNWNPESAAEKDVEREGTQAESPLPPTRPGIREHYLVLDVHPLPNPGPASQQQLSDRLPSPSPSSVETAHALSKSYPYTVTSARSLSSDWQVFRTSIMDAPTMNSEQQHPDEQHLMLRIEGRGNSPDKPFLKREGETIEDMIERFQTRLAEIRNLMAETDLEEPGEEADPGGDLFAAGGLVGPGFQPTGFGNAVLDEQD